VPKAKAKNAAYAEMIASAGKRWFLSPSHHQIHHGQCTDLFVILEKKVQVLSIFSNSKMAALFSTK
jgi:hypothetical protein